MDEELQPWDDEAASLQPDDNMSLLDQLQLYQKMVRTVFPYLDVYEAAALAQVFDRITGWKKREARFSIGALYRGDEKVYGGLTRVMHESRLMKALASLERRGVIRRRDQRYSKVKIYSINLDVPREELARTAPPVRRARPGYEEQE